MKTKTKQILFTTWILLMSLPQRVFADTDIDFNAMERAIEDDPLGVLVRGFILVVIVNCALKAGGKLIGSARNMISDALNGGSSHSDERARLKEQKAQERANRKARAKEEAYQRNQSYAAAEEFLLECAEGAAKAGRFVGEKVRAAGRWVKEKFTRKGKELKAGADMAVAAAAPSPITIGKAAKSLNGIRERPRREPKKKDKPFP